MLDTDQNTINLSFFTIQGGRQNTISILELMMSGAGARWLAQSHRWDCELLEETAPDEWGEREHRGEKKMGVDGEKSQFM